MSPTDRVRNEDGTVLVLVLVFMTVFGLITAGFLSQGDANFRSTTSVKRHDAKIYAADAGIEYGINTLKAETQWCPDPTAGLMHLHADPNAAPGSPSINVDGVDVDVTCQTQIGQGQGGYGYAIITNNPDPNSPAISTLAAADKEITGLIYNSGGWGLQSDLYINQGSVIQKTFPGCDTTPSTVTGGTQMLSGLAPGPGIATLRITPSPPFKWTCTSNPPPNPAHALPAAIPPIAPIPTKVGNGANQCTTLHPGRYVSDAIRAPGQSFLNPTWIAQGFTNPSQLFSGPTYLESGVYYFDDLGKVSINGNNTVVYGGRQTAGDSKVLPSSSCSFTDPSTTESGVEIILGRSSKLAVDQGAQVELFTHTSTAAGAPSNLISLYQVPPGTAAPWDTEVRTLPDTDFVFDVSGNANTVGDIHGAIYAPHGSITLFVSNSAGAALFGGTDAWNVVVKSSGSSPPGGLQVSTIQQTPGQRQIVITATARGGVSGEKNITSRAVITIDNSVSPRKANVLSWWTDNL